MIKYGIDQEALIKQFSDATAKQGDAIRKVVTETTLKALQGRELTLANIRQVLNTVAKAASTGAASSPLAPPTPRRCSPRPSPAWMRRSTQAVQANRKALQQMIDQGADLRETQVKKALADIEKMEDTLLRGAAQGGRGLAGVARKGRGPRCCRRRRARARTPAPRPARRSTQLLDSAQKNLRDGRALGMRASQAMLDSYSTLVSGVLIGMSDALQQGGAAARRRDARKK